MDFIVPSSLRLKELVEFCRELNKAPLEGEVTLDFGQMSHPGPFALLMLSSVVRSIRRERPNLRILPRNYAQHRYCSHMGFFRAMGVDYGKGPGVAYGSERYLPITIQEVVSIRQESGESGRPIGELVDEEARSLAGVLTQSSSGPVYETLSFALREIVRNTVEHSRSPAVEWCAQYWTQQDRVEIAVIDRGIGIYESLKQNPSLDVKHERHAINMALLPGISRNVRLDVKQVFRNVWQNSGFGLFMTQRMCLGLPRFPGQ